MSLKKDEAAARHLAEAAEGIVDAGLAGEPAADAVLASAGVARADLGRQGPGQRAKLAADLRRASVSEEILADDLARNGRDSRTAEAAWRLLADVSGLVDRGGLPPGEDPRSLEVRALVDLALTTTVEGVDQDEAVGRILRHVGVEPGREDRTKAAVRTQGERSLRAAATMLRNASRSTAAPEPERERSAAAQRTLNAAYLQLAHPSRPSRR